MHFLKARLSYACAKKNSEGRYRKMIGIFIWLIAFFPCISLSMIVEEEKILPLSDLIQNQLFLPDALFNRTKQYSTKYKKIVIDTIPRTGSLLLYNVLRYLFEYEEYLNMNYRNFYMNPVSDAIILFGHGCSDLVETDSEDVIIISSIRNPEDIIFSHCQLNLKDKFFFKKNLNEIVKKEGDYILNHWERIDLLYQRSRNMRFLSFKMFNEELDFLLDKIQSIFDIDIDPRDRFVLCSCLDKTVVQEYLIKRKLFSFDQVDDITGFHGSHVGNARISDQEKIEIFKAIREYLYANPIWEQLYKKYSNLL